MELPSLLPTDFSDVSALANDHELYDLLLRRTDRLVRFFSAAADDETWSGKHHTFMRLTLSWLTNQYIQDRLADEFANEVLKAVHLHYDILNPLLPEPFQMVIGTTEIPFNPLLIGQMSEYLHDRMQREFREHNSLVVNIKEVDPALADMAVTYMESGAIESLWKWSKEEVAPLLAIAEKWGLKGLSEECQRILCRYVTDENLTSSLLNAQKKGWELIKERCIELFNAHNEGAALSSHAPNALGFEFLDFRDKTWEQFEKVKAVVTELIVRGKLTLDPQFEKALLSCPKLFTLDLSDSEEWSPYLSKIPSQVQELAIARCAWLTDKTFRTLSDFIQQISLLNISQNTQLTYLGFGELKKFRGLKSLDISRMPTITESELLIILQSLPLLSEINLLGCKKLSDQAFYDLARRAPRLQKLNLARTSVTDGGLTEIGVRCAALENLTLDFCPNVSERGLADFLKAARNLRVLSFSNSRISQQTLENLMSKYPTIHFS